MGCVNVTVAGFEGFVDGVLLGVFVLPGAQADGGDLDACVEVEVGCHIVSVVVVIVLINLGVLFN